MPLTGKKLKRQVEALFDVVPSRCTSSELVFVCPVPGCGDRTGNRSVNLKNGKTNCWRCGHGGDFIRWCRRFGYAVDDEGAPEADLAQAETSLTAVEPIAKLVTPVVSGCRLPQGFTSCSRTPKSIYERLIAKMAEDKNLSYDDMLRAGVGYTKLDPTWEPYAVFPVLEWGRVVYFQGRRYYAEPGQPTKRFPSRNEVTYGSKYWVYNIDRARKSAKVVVVVESILNVLSLENKLAHEGLDDVVPVCVFKHAVSRPQLAKILALKHVEELCVLFDADATREAWAFAESISNLRRVTVAEMPKIPGFPTLDANDDVDEAFKAFLGRKTVNSALGSMIKDLETLE